MHMILTDDDVRLILALIEERTRLKREISNISNSELARKFGVSVRQIERVESGDRKCLGIH